ncbi:MAG TPA: hypothetical protein VEU50_05730 [Archangium sp.]|nr:hypothetical protein [Archangium sp.]HYO52267.1 hypothetical protein [Archangium sp.]
MLAAPELVVGAVIVVGVVVVGFGTSSEKLRRHVDMTSSLG